MEKSFLFYDDYDSEKIVGNRAGLEALLSSIELSIENGNSTVVLNGKSYLKVELREDLNEYLKEVKPSLINRAIGYTLTLLVGVWLIVLPLIGIGAIAKAFFFESDSSLSEAPPKYLTPLPDVLNDKP